MAATNTGLESCRSLHVLWEKNIKKGRDFNYVVWTANLTFFNLPPWKLLS